VKDEPRYWPDVGDDVWDRIRTEFGLLTEDDLEMHFETLYGDPEPTMRRLVRVFVGAETLFPGFQIVDGQPSPVVLALFVQALELKIPHNVFAAWMVTPVRRGSQRPVDALDRALILAGALDDFGHGRPWVPPWAAVHPADRRPAP
jgi:hypothetical protein